jgi:hypothetical protein
LKKGKKVDKQTKRTKEILTFAQDHRNDLDEEMSTYHGITQATCLNCGLVTLDKTALEILNDSDATCSHCGFHFVAWFVENGKVIITGEKENGEEIRLEIETKENN